MNSAKRFLKSIYLAPFSVLMGNMGTGSTARMLREAEEADKLFSEDGKQETGQEPTPEKAGLQSGHEPVPEKKEEPAEAQNVTALQAELATQKAEISRLKAMLEDENSPTYRQKYATLQGMFNAETTKLRAEIEELKKSAAEKSKEPEPAVDLADFEELKAEVGEKTAKILKPYLDKIKSLEDALSGVAGEVKTTKEKAGQLEVAQAQTAEERFFANLDAIAPDWKKINGWESDGLPQDPRFSGFMTQVIPGTASTYQDAMVAHYQNRNAAKVAEIFDLFKKSVGIAEQPKKEDPPEEKKPAANDVEKYVEPDKTGKGTTPPTGQEEIIPHAEYDAFIKSVTRGTFRGTREERAKLEARYDKALAENRIR